MSQETSKQAKYVHGHHPTVLRNHASRTAYREAAYLLPHLKPGMRILDIGCGPGTITCDFATIASQGSVVGIDPSDSVIESAQVLASQRGLNNVQFEVGDVYNLNYPDESFDVVHAHQVLQHLGDPVRALREMKRITKKGGIVASRETDVSTSVWYPENKGIEEWLDIYMRTAEGLGTNPHAGRKLQVYAREAGFPRKDVTMLASANCYGTTEQLTFWCDMWADRIKQSEFRQNALQGGYATEEQLDLVENAWRDFAKIEDAVFTLVHGEMLYKP
jgi:ubiquinone/menaquinone biosynthesis C-methylase UbiE